LGAQDYIVKGEFDEKLLAKSIQYSLERKSINKILRESLERYALINKATQDIIWEWNLETNEIIRNDAFTTLFGYPNDPVMNNRNWILEKTHPSDKERLQTNIEYCIEHRLEKWQEEYRILASDGSYKDVLDRAFIQFDNTGKPSRMIGAMTDLTEKKNLEIELAEQQLNQQKLLLEVNIQAHEEEKKELGRELHDNINQMLAAVKMYLGMAKSGRGMPEDDLVGKSYNYLNEAMLEIRKLSHSLVAPSLGDMGLKEALQELIKNSNYFKLFHVQLLIDESYNEKNIDKNKVLMFYRIAQEQLNNVTKYAKAKNVVISVKTEDGHMYLSVIDNGVGFDTTKKANGIGLKNISSRIEFYSGKTSIISAPGKGCKLEVSIPL
jgi:two-component system sensor histidine kinase UhpB